MRYSCPPSKALSTILMAVVPSTLLFVIPVRSVAQVVVPVGSFRSVTLRNGGEVTLRHGSNPRVTLLKGTPEYTKAAIADGDRLVIDGCPDGCPKGYELVVEILAPDIDEITVMDGGRIQSRGSFPRQAELRAAVENGGTIDLRSMAVDVVTATVRDGGRILTKPKENLVASIACGGVVTYWGNPRVRSSVEKGGVVSRGAAADANKPLPKIDAEFSALPAVPPVPPVPPN